MSGGPACMRVCHFSSKFIGQTQYMVINNCQEGWRPISHFYAEDDTEMGLSVLIVTFPPMPRPAFVNFPLLNHWAFTL